MKEYGTIDEDRAPYDALVKALDGEEVKYILHHPRKPINARPCQLPGSIQVQAITPNNQIITAFQAKKGGSVQITGFIKGKYHG